MTYREEWPRIRHDIEKSHLWSAGSLGALVIVGMVTATTQGELASMYSPAELAAGVVPLGLVALVLAVVAPYATGATAMAWMVGSIVAAVTAARTGQTVYVMPWSSTPSWQPGSL